MPDARPRRSRVVALALVLAFAPRLARADDVPVEIRASDGRTYEVEKRTGESVTLHVPTRYGNVSTRAYVHAPLCATPCNATLVTGEHVLAVIHHGDSIEGGAPVLITGPSRIDVDYTDNSGARAVGAVVFCGSLIGATALLLGAGSSHDDSAQRGYLVGGLSVLLVGTIFGLAMFQVNDSVSFHVEPLTLAPLGGRERGPSAVLPQGLALTAAF
jgi:hypothetical protein